MNGWAWVVVIAALIVGFMVGRSVSSNEGTALLLDAAQIADGMAVTVDLLAEAQQAEQKAYTLWVDTMQTEINGLRELQSGYPNATWFDEAIGAAIDARRQATIAADLSAKYWNANKAEADRLRSLAVRLRDYAY